LSSLSVRTIQRLERGQTASALAVANFVLYPRYLWVVALAWGIGLAFHGLRAFDKIPFLTGDWEQRRVEKYLGRKL
jgi:hypothetical protein